MRRESFSLQQRLFAVIRAISVNEKLDTGSDSAPCGGHPLEIRRWVSADFHFDPTHSGCCPTRELVLQLFEGI